MRTLLSAILVLSLFGNGWGWLALRRGHDGSPAQQEFVAGRAPEVGAEKTDTPATPSSLSGAETRPLSLPVDQSPAAVRDWMRQFGVPEPVVRQAIHALLAAPRMQWSRDLLRNLKQVKGALASAAPERDSYASQRRDEEAVFFAEEKQGLKELFGTSLASVPDLERPFWSYLKPENVEAVAALVKDYEARLVGMSSFQHLFASQELLRELSGRLSPEELAEFDRREGYTTQRLSSRFDAFPGTAEERLKVFEITSQFHRERAAAGAVASPSEVISLDDLLMTHLGSDSYAAWQATRREDYVALLDIKQRVDVPEAALATVEKLVVNVGNESRAILNNTALSDAQRAAALRALAEKARSEVRRTLGTSAGDAYLNVAQKTWLKRLDEGQAFGFTKKGSFYIYVLRPPPSASPPPRN